MTFLYPENSLKPIPKQSNVKYFIIFLLLKLATSFLTSSIATYMDPSSTHNPVEDYDLTSNIILSLFLGPLIETLIFQFLIIELLLKTKLNPLFIISISALLFGLSHNYNILYIIATTISGFFYAIYYYKLRNQGKTISFLLVSVLHSLSNVPGFFM